MTSWKSTVLVIILLSVSSVIGSPIREIRIPTRIMDEYSFQRHEPITRTLTLALSGGGARGLAHIGVLEVLDKAGIQPNGIVGVSIGSLIGGLYASGMTPAEIATHLKRLDWNGLLFDEPERRTLSLARKEDNSRHLLTLRLGKELSPVIPGAVSPGQRLYQQLLELTLNTPYRSENWKDLKIPFQVLATDLVTGKRVVLENGDLTPAIRGSMSIPLLFEPLIWDTLQLIDGGVSSNIPVREAHEMGNDIVMAVDASSPLRYYEPPHDPWQIVDQVTTILELEASLRSLENADLIVSPNLGDIPAIALVDPDSLIELGRVAMKEMLPRLQEIIRAHPKPDDSIFLPINEIYIDPYARTPLKTRLNQQQQTGLYIKDIRAYLRQLYSLGTVAESWATYDSVEQSLRVDVRYNPQLSEIIFSGNKLVSDNEIEEIFWNLYNRRLNPDLLEQAIEDLMRLYRKEGYPAASIENTHFNDSTHIMSIEIEEGTLDELCFVGLDRIAESWLAKEVPLKVGEPITSYGIRKGMSNLYATGLFRNIFPSLIKSDNGWKLTIHASEQPVPLIRLGLSYLEELKTRGFIEVTYPGLFNYAEQLSLYAGVGLYESKHQLTFSSEKILGQPLTYAFSFGYSRDDRIRYDEKHKSMFTFTDTRWGGSVEFGVPAFSWGLGALTSRWERHINTFPVGNSYIVSTFGGRVAIDTQDRFPYPNYGIKSDLCFESSVGKHKFWRSWGKWESYLTPVHRHTVGLRFSGAIADAATPLDEQFRLGGMHSLPGLHRDELVGALQMSSGIEYRFDLISRILADSYVGFRYDIAGSWSDPQTKIKRLDLVRSISTYFAFDTLIGPIHLQWGHLYPVNGLNGDNRIDVQIGNQF